MARKPFLPPAVQALKDSIEDGSFDSPPAEPADDANTEPAADQPVADSDPAFTEQAAVPATPDDGGLRAAFDAMSAEHEKLKHKFSVLQGKYDTEPARLRQEIRELTIDLDDLTRKLAARTPVVHDEPDPIDAADVDVVGADALRVMERIAARKASEAVQPFATDAQQTAFEKFKATVAGEVPDWFSVVNHAGFEGFAESINDETGETHGDLLKAALSNRAAPRVIALYKKAKKFIGMASTAPDTTAQSAAPGVVVKSLADRVAPSGASTASTPSTALSKVYARSEVDKFYREWSAKKTKALDPKERLAWEAKERDITAAGNQGRIREG